MQVARKQRFLLLSLPNSRMSKEAIMKDMEEIWSLVTTAGNAEIVDAMVQRADNPDGATYIGPGKVVELFEKVKDERIDIVVVNGIAKPGQLHNLKRKLYEANHAIEVWDRVDLILFIFSKHAHTSEAKLQIELAKMRHMGPRIYGMGLVMSQQSAGIGTVGVGETNTELMKRHWSNAMKKVQENLEKLSEDRERQLERRKRLGLTTVSIVGYTNAGKTSLFNLLSGKHKLTENALFATLDSAVGKMYLPNAQKEVLITDTIGFIKNLPPKLIQAFKSTLLESIHADLLIHVIDASDSEMQSKILVVEQILSDLKIDENTTMIYVFNKIDSAKDIDKEEMTYEYQQFSPHVISVKNRDGVEELQKSIDRVITQKL